MDKMFRRLIGENIELVTIPAEDLWPVKIDTGQIEQVLTNLVVNARDAMPEYGKLIIETANVTLDEAYTKTHAGVKPGDYVMMAVSDTGEGMDEDTMLHIFEPFFTTKEQSKGTGLGLSTCYGIIKQNSGNIWVYSEPGHGASFKIYLPREFKEITSNIKRKNNSPEGTETIIVVEDESDVRQVTSNILRDKGYIIYEAASGEEALRIAEKDISWNIHLLLTDVIMPHMSGKELSEHFNRKNPDIKVLFVSGYTDNSIVNHGVIEKGIAFLQKPFSSSSLICKVRDVLDE